MSTHLGVLRLTRQKRKIPRTELGTHSTKSKVIILNVYSVGLHKDQI